MFLSSTQTHDTYDMQHDLLRSLRDLDLRSTFEADLSRSTYIWFDSSRRENHDGKYPLHCYTFRNVKAI